MGGVFGLFGFACLLVSFSLEGYTFPYSEHIPSYHES